jgi:cytochrome P450
MDATVIAGFRECDQALREASLQQSLYDKGEVVMKDVLLTLHGDAHQRRRQLEVRVFRRNFFKYYEQEVFPPTLEQTLAPVLAAGHVDLIQFGYWVTINLTADFAGVDRPEKTVEETEALLKMVKTFSEGATLVHSLRDPDEVSAEVRDALAAFDRCFLQPSIARRRLLLRRLAAGEIAEEDLPRDVLTVLLRNEDALDLPDDIVLREIAFYMQAGSHSTANATVHALHEILTWAGEDTGRWRRLGDPLFVQRCVHESLRLHPASPESWRRATCPVHIAGAGDVDAGQDLVMDLHRANRDPAIFGEDADRFDPDRPLPKGVMPFGLTFGLGVHSCVGRELDGGIPARADSDPATRQYGIVPLLVVRLLREGARLDVNDPPTRDPRTKRPNWGRYPVVFERDAAVA